MSDKRTMDDGRWTIEKPASLEKLSSIVHHTSSALRPRKSLGQNFLTDRTVPPRIAVAAEIEPDDLIVEVGPGLGILTEELASRLDPQKGGKLIAVELDDRLIPVLEKRFEDSPHVEFKQGDILDISLHDLSGGRPYKLVANLPYYITSTVLRRFLEAEQQPDLLVVMVQREVAERMAAAPPDMSLLSVAVQFYGKPKVMFRVPPGAFHPVPKVESAVVRIDVYKPDERPVSTGSEAAFFRLVRAGFSQKRKQLANTLSTGLQLPKAEVAQHLQNAGVASTRRAETLTLQEWARLEAVLSAEC